MHSDHLGSISAISDLSGSVVARQWYDPYGAVRASSGALPTDITFTGHRSDATGLYFFQARYYSGLLGRFISADSIVPGAGNSQALNRYAYGLNNPIKYTDPSGHWIESAIDIAFIAYDVWDISQNGLNWENGLSLAADVGGLLLPVVTGGGVAVRAAFHADDAAKIITHADDAVHAINAVENATEALTRADDLADGARALDEVPRDLYAFGSTQGPRPPRAGKDYFPDALGQVGPESPPFPNGASTFGDPKSAPLTGPYHRLPQGTQLPDGLKVVADGVDVNPRSPHPRTHHTIYPSKPMPYNDFVEKFMKLPWEYAGKK